MARAMIPTISQCDTGKFYKFQIAQNNQGINWYFFQLPQYTSVIEYFTQGTAAQGSFMPHVEELTWRASKHIRPNAESVVLSYVGAYVCQDTRNRPCF